MSQKKADADCYQFDIVNRSTSDPTMQGKNLWVVIPAYNEGASIGSVILDLHAAGHSNICVVDDGSTDCTPNVALRVGARVVSHIVNLGQGAALQTGISYALARGARYICTFDADGQHSAASIGEMLQLMRVTGAEVALGSRWLGSASDIPALRRLFLKAALIFTWWHSGLRVSDTHNGLRLFTRYAAQHITIEQPGMAHASEILQKIRRSGMRYVEVATTVRYTAYSREKGQSNLEAVKIILDLLYRAIAHP